MKLKTNKLVFLIFSFQGSLKTQKTSVTMHLSEVQASNLGGNKKNKTKIFTLNFPNSSYSNSSSNKHKQIVQKLLSPNNFFWTKLSPNIKATPVNPRVLSIGTSRQFAPKRHRM